MPDFTAHRPRSFCNWHAVPEALANCAARHIGHQKGSWTMDRFEWAVRVFTLLTGDGLRGSARIEKRSGSEDKQRWITMPVLVRPAGFGIPIRDVIPLPRYRSCVECDGAVFAGY
jgi:hypothetical protein